MFITYLNNINAKLSSADSKCTFHKNHTLYVGVKIVYTSWFKHA